MKKTKENKEQINSEWRRTYNIRMQNPEYAKKQKERKVNYIRNSVRAQLKKRYDGIISRCTDVKHKDYKSYGGRGIKCEWKTFDNFCTDMIDLYTKAKNEIPGSLCLDRKNPNGNYCKGNTQFVSFRDNCRYNKRTSRYLTYKNKTLIIADWAIRLNTSRQSVRHRIEAGWSPEAIIETPFNYSNRYDPRTKKATSSTKNKRSQSK